MRHEVTQFAMLHRLALDARSRGKDIECIGWQTSAPVPRLWVDAFTVIEYNGDGFDVYRSKTLAQIDISYQEALNVVMGAGVAAALGADPQHDDEASSRRGRHRGRPPGKGAKLAAMLKRSEGVTREEGLRATGWPSVSFQQIAKRFDLVLTKVGNRYFGTPQSAAEIEVVEH